MTRGLFIMHPIFRSMTFFVFHLFVYNINIVGGRNRPTAIQLGVAGHTAPIIVRAQKKIWYD